jgi:Beta-galactosidase
MLKLPKITAFVFYLIAAQGWWPATVEANGNGEPAAAQAPSSAPAISTDPRFFPITVWVQTPQVHGIEYKNIGINVFSGLFAGIDNAAMKALSDAGLSTIVWQQADALASPYRAVVKGWLHDDEPDNAQPDGHGGYGPCVDPSVIVARYNAFRAADPTRPVIINFGRGAADINWVGRGSCTGRTDMYSQYARGADILSFDIYPVNGGDAITYVARGVDNLRRWGGGKPVWAFVETTRYNTGNGQPTPAQVKAEVWLALTHGASGIQYFCHILTPRFIEAGLLSDSAMTAAVKRINLQIKSLATVLNSPTIANGATVSAGVRIDKMVKRAGGFTYLFAVNPTRNQGNAAFTLSGLSSGTVTVLGEGRSLTMSGGGFTDNFAGYGVHLYKISGG